MSEFTATPRPGRPGEYVLSRLSCKCGNEIIDGHTPGETIFARRSGSDGLERFDCSECDRAYEPRKRIEMVCVDPDSDPNDPGGTEVGDTDAGA